MEILYFAGKMTLVSGLLTGYYWLFLRNKPFHHYNRYYLLGSAIVPFILPLLPSAFPSFSSFLQQSSPVKLMQVIAGNPAEPDGRQSFYQPDATSYNWSLLLKIVYGAGCGLLLVILMRSIIYLRHISRQHAYQLLKNVRFYLTGEKGSPFSFFNRIFWNRAIPIDSDEGQQILRHELYHVRQLHSADLLLLECVSIVSWFNPFNYLIKKELRAEHEFLADRYAVSDDNRYAYAELLLLHSIRQKQYELVNPFFQTNIKRRIHMLTHFKKTPNNFSRMMILPLVCFIFCAFVSRMKHPAFKAKSNPIAVVIDAGHGGMDDGAVGSAGLKEKDLNLKLAQKIESLSAEYNITVIMTRSTDILPGNSQTIQDGLVARTDLANQKKADLFVSIHVNNDDNHVSRHGFEIFVSRKNAFYNKSVSLGSSIGHSLKDHYEVEDQLKQTDSIRVLRAAQMPSILVECGFIKNAQEMEELFSDAGIEKMARDILKGIDTFRKTGPAASR